MRAHARGSVMAIAPPAPRRLREDHRGLPTSPLRIYAADHQPIRLLAELETISAAELVHRALENYLDQHRVRLAEIATRAQRMVEAGDLEGLAEILDSAKASRRSVRAARLAALSAPVDAPTE
jgi:hypothetical protein